MDPIGTLVEWVTGIFPGAWILVPIFGVVIIFFGLLYAMSSAIVPAPDPSLINVVFMTGLLVCIAGGAAWLWVSNLIPFIGVGISGGLGALTLFATVRGWRDILRLRRAGTTVAGKINEVGWDMSRNLFNRTVKYTYSHQGRQYDEQENYRRRTLKPHIGDSVQVVIDPEKPERAMLAVNLRR